MRHSILIIEDDITFSTMLKTWLGKQGFDVETVSNNARARKIIIERDFDLVLSDMRLPDQDGMSLLTWMRENGHDEPFIIMTGYADIQGAVNAMKNGAFDYIAKPVQPDILMNKIEEALKVSDKQQEENETDGSAENESAKQKPNGVAKKESVKNDSEKSVNENFIEGESEAARQLYNYVALVAPTPLSVLITGASGTGKEYVANRIHQLSKRGDKPFVAIDCGSIPKELVASEFFGHVKGAFTDAQSDKTGYFTEANGGTLFLDEVENLGYEAQIQLLRAIQERKIRPVGSSKTFDVDVRIICATNENLLAAIQEGKFREDLFHRINEFTIRMPELKERGEDILLFANFFLDQANKELERNIIGFDSKAYRMLMNYEWPGNVRELKNVVKRAALLAQGKYITPTELDLNNSAIIPNSTTLAGQMSTSPLQTPQNTSAPRSFVLKDENTEKERILAALQQTNYNKSKAAALLNIDRKTLYNKLKLYGLQ